MPLKAAPSWPISSRRPIATLAERSPEATRSTIATIWRRAATTHLRIAYQHAVAKPSSKPGAARVVEMSVSHCWT
jgi:hypothetical protein